MSRVKLKKIISVIVCICIVFVMTFSLGFIVTHTNHICHGEVCQICVSIHASQDAINKISTAVVFIAVISFMIGLFAAGYLSSSVIEQKTVTLHSLKVRLDN